MINILDFLVFKIFVKAISFLKDNTSIAYYNSKGRLLGGFESVA